MKFILTKAVKTLKVQKLAIVIFRQNELKFIVNIGGAWIERISTWTLKTGLKY